MFKSKATSWKSRNEKIALEAYLKSEFAEHINLVVECMGLMTNPACP